MKKSKITEGELKRLAIRLTAIGTGEEEYFIEQAGMHSDKVSEIESELSSYFQVSKDSSIHTNLQNEEV